MLVKVRPEPRPLADGRVVACHRYTDWHDEVPGTDALTSLTTAMD